MSRLIVRPADHPDLQTNMPAISCGICGATAQIPAAEFDVEHWDELYEGGFHDLELAELLPDGYSQAQWEHDRELEQWSQEHALTHTQDEHDRHAGPRRGGA